MIVYLPSIVVLECVGARTRTKTFCQRSWKYVAYINLIVGFSFLVVGQGANQDCISNVHWCCGS